MSRTFALAANAFSAGAKDSDLCHDPDSYQPGRPQTDPACADISPACLPCLSGEPPLQETASSASSKSVLIVSADDYLRSTMRSFLEHVGLTALACIDVRRAAHIFFGGSAVDLLLVDAHTLGADGVALAGQCSGGRPNLPVIVLSGPGPKPGSDAAGTLDAEPGFSELGPFRAWRMLRKPILLPVLLGIIRKALEPHKPPQAVIRSATVLPFAPAKGAVRSACSGAPPAEAVPITMKRRPG